MRSIGPAVTREQSPAFLRNSNGRLDFPGPTQEASSRQRWLVLDLDKQTLGAALGKASVAVAAFADVSLALAFVRTLENPDPELVADLEKRVERVKSRAESGKRSKLRKS